MHFMYSEFCFFFVREGKELRGQLGVFSCGESACLQCWVRPSFTFPTRGDLELSHTNSELGMPFPQLERSNPNSDAWEGFQHAICNLLSVCFLFFISCSCLLHACSTLYFGHDRISILQMTQPTGFHVKMCSMPYTRTALTSHFFIKIVLRYQRPLVELITPPPQSPAFWGFFYYNAY